MLLPILIPVHFTNEDTSNLVKGDAVPMPTLPDEVIDSLF